MTRASARLTASGSAAGLANFCARISAAMDSLAASWSSPNSSITRLRSSDLSTCRTCRYYDRANAIFWSPVNPDRASSIA
jgi:hypothetical protein